jgi:hypothetical protein
VKLTDNSMLPFFLYKACTSKLPRISEFSGPPDKQGRRNKESYVVIFLYI